MSTLIHQFTDFSLWRISIEDFKEASKFVVETNYKHHTSSFPFQMEDEIKYVYESEVQNQKNSIFYAVRNKENKIIGTIRALKWDGISILPMESIFGINMGHLAQDNPEVKNIWHIGCFAIDSESIGRASVIILKTLLTHAVFHVCLSSSLMVAECDRKLYEKLKLLNICSNMAGKSKNYMGSETIPVYNTSEKLKQFLSVHKRYLYLNGIEAIFPAIQEKEEKATQLHLEQA